MTAANPPKITIARTKTQALCRVLDVIPRGYSSWVAGQVSPDKAMRLAQKFHEKYGISCSPAQRITRKKAGLANTMLVMYWPAEASQVEWLLLATQGNGLESESLRPVTARPRLVFLGYELVRHSVGDRTSWTWKRSAEQMRDWHSLLASQLGQRRFGQVKEMLEMLARQPGFHGVRAQSWELFQVARQKGYPEPLPHLYFQQKGSHGERVVLGE